MVYLLTGHNFYPTNNNYWFTPLAWILARYHWKKAPLMRAILTMPFVTPPSLQQWDFLQLLEEEV